MATTTNFGWETPDDTDLVKDGALAMRTLGNAIDASLVDLKGGTTGQVLSKNSNTDMDFTWVTSDDANAIQNAIVDAKGDLIAASAADTPARLAVGNNGETLVADSSASTGLRWQPDFSVGRNKLINADFNINQRGFTSVTQASPSATFTFDRWVTTHGGTAGYSATWTPQTFTLGSAPVSGYEGKNFIQIATSNFTTADSWAGYAQSIESVRTFAGQTVTISFWARATSGTPKLGLRLQQGFGSGGTPSASVNKYATISAISTSWARYTANITLDSLSGKTLGTDGSDRLTLSIVVSAGSSTWEGQFGSMLQNNTFQIWGVQVEAGNVATAFQTATGTLQGELAACQRYYWRTTASNIYEPFATAIASSTSGTDGYVQHPVEMRIAPTSIDSGSLSTYDGVTQTTITSVAFHSSGSGKRASRVAFTVASGLTQYRPYNIIANGTTNAYLGMSAEL